MDIWTYEPVAGDDVKNTAKRIVEIAKLGRCVVEASFNGVLLRAYRSTLVEEVVEYYDAAIRRERKGE